MSFLSVDDVAKHYGVTKREVYYAARRDKLIQHKIGWGLVFRLEELPEEWPIRRKKVTKIEH